VDGALDELSFLSFTRKCFVVSSAVTDEERVCSLSRKRLQCSGGYGLFARWSQVAHSCKVPINHIVVLFRTDSSFDLRQFLVTPFSMEYFPPKNVENFRPPDSIIETPPDISALYKTPMQVVSARMWHAGIRKTARSCYVRYLVGR
jgi:hypothetical protein